MTPSVKGPFEPKEGWNPKGPSLELKYIAREVPAKVLKKGEAVLIALFRGGSGRFRKKSIFFCLNF